ILLARHPPGPAPPPDPPKLARPERRHIIQIHMHVPRHKNIHETILVIVRPCRPGHEPAPAHSSLLGHILKLAISQPAIQSVPAIPRNKNIQHSIIIKIRHRQAHPPTLARQTRRLRHVFKPPGSPRTTAPPHPPIKSNQKTPATLVTLNGRS